MRWDNSRGQKAFATWPRLYFNVRNEAPVDAGRNCLLDRFDQVFRRRIEANQIRGQPRLRSQYL